ncbi:MAG: hypothetical protein ICCCNLDF_00036 [Planctomycetes bacterium]|nr:hypothetical protein [Planctomycetota bacterium]
MPSVADLPIDLQCLSIGFFGKLELPGVLICDCKVSKHQRFVVSLIGGAENCQRLHVHPNRPVGVACVFAGCCDVSENRSFQFRVSQLDGDLKRGVHRLFSLHMQPTFTVSERQATQRDALALAVMHCPVHGQ